MIETKKRIDWDSLTAGYGPEAQKSIRELLSQYDIDEEDPIAMLIASMFVSQVDTLRAFSTIEATIEAGRSNLSKEFSEQVFKLRGIIAYAEDNLMQTSKASVEARHDELLSVVKAGVSHAISRSGSRAAKENTLNTVSLMIAASGLCLLGLIIGVLGAKVVNLPGGRQSSAPSGLVSAQLSSRPSK